MGLLLSQKFGRLYLFQIKFFFKMRGEYLIALKKVFPNNVQHALIKAHLTPTFQGFVVGTQILNLTLTLSFEHNSCKSCLNPNVRTF